MWNELQAPPPSMQHQATRQGTRVMDRPIVRSRLLGLQIRCARRLAADFEENAILPLEPPQASARLLVDCCPRLARVTIEVDPTAEEDSRKVSLLKDRIRLLSLR